MKKLLIENNKEIKSSQDLLKILFENRGIKTKKETEDFLNPSLSKISPSFVKINKRQLKKALQRIQKAIKQQEKIIIYGDYDVDGISATAILWETLNSLGANASPFIPSRFEEGYGLSKEGIDILSEKEKVGLIITVDNGIVANEAVNSANKNGIDVIITDHHLPAQKLPNAFAIIHTTLVCGAGVAYLLAKELKIKNSKLEIEQDDHLALVALATIADLVPLTNANRIFVYFGLLSLRQTKRIGINALIDKAGIEKAEIGVYEIGHILAPRLNAMGRLASAMDSLRLICTNNKERADKLADLLSKTNFERQQVTMSALTDAKNKVEKKQIKNIIFIADESYQQGIVGLVAGRLVEEYYFPSIVISKGKKYSKASARSIKGFNIIEFLRTASDLLVDVGGHPMAAGFTVETDKLELLEKKLYQSAEKLLNKKHLLRSLRVDAILSQNLISLDTYSQIQKLAPFGMANPEPTFLTKNFVIEDMRLVGNDGKHLKLKFIIHNSEFRIEGIAFGIGQTNEFKIGDRVDVVYTIDINEWNGNKKLELKIKDITII